MLVTHLQWGDISSLPITEIRIYMSYTADFTEKELIHVTNDINATYFIHELMLDEGTVIYYEIEALNPNGSMIGDDKLKVTYNGFNFALTDSNNHTLTIYNSTTGNIVEHITQYYGDININTKSFIIFEHNSRIYKIDKETYQQTLIYSSYFSDDDEGMINILSGEYETDTIYYQSRYEDVYGNYRYQCTLLSESGNIIHRLRTNHRYYTPKGDYILTAKDISRSDEYITLYVYDTVGDLNQPVKTINFERRSSNELLRTNTFNTTYDANIFVFVTTENLYIVNDNGITLHYEPLKYASTRPVDIITTKDNNYIIITGTKILKFTEKYLKLWEYNGNPFDAINKRIDNSGHIWLTDGTLLNQYTGEPITRLSTQDGASIYNITYSGEVTHTYNLILGGQ